MIKWLIILKPYLWNIKQKELKKIIKKDNNFKINRILNIINNCSIMMMKILIQI